MNNQPVGGDPFADTKLGNALTRAIVDTIHEPFIVLDADLRIIVASRSFYKKFKETKEDTQGRLLYQIGNGQYDIPALKHFLSGIIPDHSVMKEYKIVHEFLHIGRRTLILSAREVIYENSVHKYVLLSIGDITGQELVDAEREKLSKQKDLMIKEMKHRMANSLQLIASILILKSEVVESVEARTHLKDAHERIMSIATVEKYLDTTSLDEEVEVGPYLIGLCQSLSKSMIPADSRIVLRVEAQGGMTTSAEGICLGLITAELVINALKHAFPQGRAGTILVEYKTDNGGWDLSVSDDGVGIVHDPARKGGLGTSIVQSLTHQLRAQVATKTGKRGTKVSITSAPKTLGRA